MSTNTSLINPGCLGAPLINFGAVKRLTASPDESGHYPVATEAEIACSPPFDKGSNPPNIGCLASGHWSDATKSACANGGSGGC